MAMDYSKQYLEARQAKQARQVGGTNVPQRGTVHGDAGTVAYSKGVYGLADEGSYFMVKNPTVGTGIAGIAAADGAEGLEQLLFLRNTSTVSEGKRVYIDRLRLIPTAAGTNGTTTMFVSVIDSGTNRYTSGGTDYSSSIKNMNMDSSDTAPVFMAFGAVVTAAPSADVRIVGGGALRLGVIKVIGDIYDFDFGASSRAQSPSAVTSGTAQIHVVWPHAPVVLGPQQMWMLEVYGASQSVAASFEFELGFYVR
jgi:hypothetical protein